MGIEPTSDALTPLNGFEDRDNHQIAITSGIHIVGMVACSRKLHRYFRVSIRTNRSDANQIVCSGVLKAIFELCC